MDFCLSKKEERTLWEIYKRGSGGMVIGDCSELSELAEDELVAISVPGFDQPSERSGASKSGKNTTKKRDLK